MKRKIRRYAVTGGIGSGKSFFLQILKERGYAVFSCDEIYAAMRREPEFLDRLKAEFPSCTDCGTFDFSRLSALVFSDPAALTRLDALTHPEIIRRLLTETEREEVSFCEVPLLFEGGYAKKFNGAVAVVRPIGERIASVMERSGLTREEVLARMARQCSVAESMQRADIVVLNRGDLQEEAEHVLSFFGLPPHR